MKTEFDHVSPAAGLVDAQRLLECLFPDDRCRPSLRWLRTQQKRRVIPFHKVGRLVFFDVEESRAAILARGASRMSRAA